MFTRYIMRAVPVVLGLLARTSNDNPKAALGTVLGGSGLLVFLNSPGFANAVADALALLAEAVRHGVGG